MWSTLCRHPIHNLVQYHAPDDIILALLSAQKDAAKSLDTSDDVFPLHHAIEFNVPDVIILALLEAHSEAAQIRGVNGDLPLLMAIKSNSSDDVILAVLAAYKDAAWKGYDEQGKLPIYHAVENCSYDIIVELLIEVVCSPLPQKWDVLNDAVRLKGEDIILEVAEGASDTLVRHGILCNMITTKSETSDEVIIQLISNFPETARTKDSDGNFPLHLAMHMKSSIAVITTLFRAHKRVSKVSSSQGNLPLHLGLKNGYEKCNKFLVELLTSNQKAAALKDEDGDLPLHLALENKCSDQIVLEILGASPKDATTFTSRSSKGYLPLHAAIHREFSDNVILSILFAFPKAATIKNPTGEFPLYTCIEMKRSDKVILALLEAHMGATKESSTKGDLPLHRMIKKGYSDEVIIKIFSAFPCAAMIRCQMTGMLPLHLAAASNVSSSVIESLIRKYPEALEKLANGSTPSDLVTSALPTESIEMICKPVSYWKDDARNGSESAEQLEIMSQKIMMMSEILLEVGNKLHLLTTKVESAQNLAIPGALHVEDKQRDRHPRDAMLLGTLQRGQHVPSSVCNNEDANLSFGAFGTKVNSFCKASDGHITNGKYKSAEAKSIVLPFGKDHHCVKGQYAQLQGDFENSSLVDGDVVNFTKDLAATFITRVAEKNLRINVASASSFQASAESGSVVMAQSAENVEAACSFLTDEARSLTQHDLPLTKAEERVTEAITAESLGTKSFEAERHEVLDYLNVRAREFTELRTAVVNNYRDEALVGNVVVESIGSDHLVTLNCEPSDSKEVTVSAINVDHAEKSDTSCNQLTLNHENDKSTDEDPSKFVGEILKQVNEDSLGFGFLTGEDLMLTTMNKDLSLPAAKSNSLAKTIISDKCEESEIDARDEVDSYCRNAYEVTSSTFNKQQKVNESALMVREKRYMTCSSYSSDPQSFDMSQSSESFGTLLFIDEISEVCVERFLCFGENVAPSSKRIEITKN